MIVKMRLKTKDLDGIEIMLADIGKEYLIDLASKRTAFWHSLDHNHCREVEVVRDVEVHPNDMQAWIPCEVLELV